MSCSKCRQGSTCFDESTQSSPSTCADEQVLEAISEPWENTGSPTNTETCHGGSDHVVGDKPTSLGSNSNSVAAMNGDHRNDDEVKGKNGQKLEDQETMVSFRKGDPENPYNWSARKKTFVLMAGIIAVVNSTLGSSLPSGAINYISKDFQVTNEQQLVLPISLFLVGYVLGPIFFGPLSETYGRRIIMISSFAVFTVFTMACALAPSWPALLVFRLICGVNASSAIAVVGGLCADVFGDPVIRGRAMAIFMVVSETMDGDIPLAC